MLEDPIKQIRSPLLESPGLILYKDQSGFTGQDSSV